MVNTLFKGRLSRMSSTGAAATIPKTVEVKSVSHGMNFTLHCCYMYCTLQSVTKLCMFTVGHRGDWVYGRPDL